MTAGHGRTRTDSWIPPAPTPPSTGTARGSLWKWRPAAGTKRPPGRCCSELEKRADKVKGESSHGRRRRGDRPPGDAACRPLRRLPRPPEGEGRSRKTQIDNTRSRLNRVAADCGFKRLADLNGDRLERWLVARQGRRHGGRDPQRLPRSLGDVRQLVLSAIAGCCPIRSPRCRRPTPRATRAGNAGRWPKTNLIRLLDVARRRPLLDAMTVRRGKRKGEAVAEAAGRNPPPAGTARAGTGVDLQDAGADRASQGRTGFAHRGATGARRRPALSGARRRRRKEPGRQLDSPSG